jgi:hypothetical protein
MIISHKHKFIFIHCRKAAGSSITMSLSRFLGPEDLQFSAITDGAKHGIHPPRRVITEAVRSARLGDWLAVLVGKKGFWSVVSSSIRTRYAATLGQGTAHPRAEAIVSVFPEPWQQYFRFCVVRNPWDKTLSDYHWRTKRLASPPGFEEYVNALRTGERMGGIVPQNHDNWAMYTIGDEIAVDHVVRFEDLATGLAEALAHTSVPWDGWLPHMKQGAGSKQGGPRRDYRDSYNAETAEIVRQLYLKEIEAFGYAF